jgi:type I restriction enzyme S subunit
LFIRIGNLTRDGIGLDLSDVQRVAVPDGAEGERTRVAKDDVLFSITAYLGSVAVVSTEIELAYVSQHVALARLRGDRLLPRWVAYLTLSDVGKSYLKAQGYGGTKIQLSLDDVANLLLTVPPVHEQQRIATFLDRETAKIDALVEEQRRLIELLKEKRQAVISHAVTKGLDPNAPMKDSGVEWLGEVPAHWEVKRVKDCTLSIEQGWSPQCDAFPVESRDEWGVLKVGCVNAGYFDPSENKAFPIELKPMPELGVVAGDVLISRANTRELVGRAAVATENHSNLMICDKLYRIRLRERTCSPTFLGAYLGASNVRGQIELSATGASSSMVNIGQATILELAIPVPPTAEQIAIARQLDQERLRIDGLVAASESAIALLQERRSALISAAVTGKIDVRRQVDEAKALREAAAA